MKWTDYINYIKERMRKLIYLFGLKKELDFRKVKMAYFAYCQSISIEEIILRSGAYKPALSSKTFLFLMHFRCDMRVKPLETIIFKDPLCPF